MRGGTQRGTRNERGRKFEDFFRETLFSSEDLKKMLSAVYSSIAPPPRTEWSAAAPFLDLNHRTVSIR